MVPSRSTAMMMSGELSIRRWRYFWSSVNILMGVTSARAVRPAESLVIDLLGGARPELRQSYLVVQFFEHHLNRHPALYLVRLDPDEIGDDLRPFLQFNNNDGVWHLRGKGGMVNLVHNVKAVDLAAAADPDPVRPRRQTIRASLMRGKT